MQTKGLLRSLTVAVLSAWTLIAAAPGVRAQPMEPFTDPGVVPDDMLTLVVATHFVAPSEEGKSVRAQFSDARVPLSAFNDTDHCVDQSALELAKEYFTNLGRALGKAGHYYFVPEDEIKKTVSMCEKVYGQPPKAWIEKKTKIIAFGRVVPTVDAPALEASIR